MPQKRRLTNKQKGFAYDVARGETITKAALNHYDIEGKDPIKIASVIGVENLEKPSVIAEIEKQKETLKSALEKQGITPAKIALKVDELLENEDPNAIDKGLKHATAIYGVVPEEKPKGNTYNFIQNTAIQADIRQLEEAIKAKLLNYAEEN